MKISYKILNNFLVLFNFKKLVEKSFYNPPRKKIKLNKYVDTYSFDFEVFKVMNNSVFTLKSKPKFTKNHIVFFHGGAYVLQGSSMHFKLIKSIAKIAKCKVSYIDYPLVPENTYHTTFEMVDLSYKLLIDKYPDDDFILMGDSAGGGLALAFVQKLVNDKAAKLPVKCVLFSPWIDLSMTNPLIKQQEIKDIILPLKGLIYAAQKYAGNEVLYNYLLSPINGDFNGLPTSLVLYGSEELFCPDIESLKEKIKNIGNFIFRRYEGMQHDWVILPIPEAKVAIKETIEFILENSESTF